ncbi:MAG TPA: hypothetical protein DCY35_04500, partial [Prolixibacteraceae bacterium]|nr:hypothetical protein [Prolixibacteraceae bacterium]
MIQRIQTAFLIVSTLLLGFLFQYPLADILAANELYVFKIGGIYKGEEQVFNGLPIQIFLILIILLHIFVIFKYKKRIQQMRI